MSYNYWVVSLILTDLIWKVVFPFFLQNMTDVLVINSLNNLNATKIIIIFISQLNPTFIRTFYFGARKTVPQKTNKQVLWAEIFILKTEKKRRKKNPNSTNKNNQHSFSISYDDSFHCCYASIVFVRLQCEAVWKAGWAVGLQTEDRHTEAGSTKRGTFKTLGTQHTCQRLQMCRRLLVVARSALEIVIKYNPGPNGR